LAVNIYTPKTNLPEISLALRMKDSGGGELCLTEQQRTNLIGPLRCTLKGRHGTKEVEGPPAWIIQKENLTFEASEEGNGSGRERRIRETGEGLVEYLSELGEREGAVAVVEYLSRTNIRYHSDDADGSRSFFVKRHAPFRSDDAPSWLLLHREDRLQLSDAILEFADRHEHNVLRRHARRGSPSGLANFYDVLNAVLKLQYRYYEHGLIPKSELVGRACRYAEIFGRGIESENDSCAGYLDEITQNMSGDLRLLRKILDDVRLVALVRISLLIAQRVRNELRRDSPKPPYPMELALQKFHVALRMAKVAEPTGPALIAVLQKMELLNESEIDLWLRGVV
jgi:hypothetical protein